MQVLEFRIDGQPYALPLGDVVEIVRAVAVTPLPDAPRVVRGVMDLRGRIVPVLDLRARFGHAPRELDPGEHFVVARAGPRTVALRVDQVTALQEVNAAAVERMDGVVPRGRWVAGLARTDHGVVLIHEPATFLSESESEAFDRALDAAQIPE